MHIPKRGVLYDFHTMPACPDVGQEFDCEAFAEDLKRCGVDFTIFPARCNLGMAYYDTKLGIRHPALQFDLLRRVVDACHRRGIAVSAYMNLGLSHEEGLRHREWTVLHPDGHAYQEPFDDHFFRTMCYNSPYAEHVLGMIRELLEYPLDGFFFDCFMPHPCIGEECIREQKQRGMTVDEFARFSRQRFLEKIGRLIRGAGDYLLFFNCVRFRDQLGVASYLEYECLPTGGWGYDALQMNARYLRTLGKPMLNMSGRFHETWGDFGGIRTRASLLADCLTGLSNGLPPNIGDHYHPRGDRNTAVLELIGGIYRELDALNPYCAGAVAVADIALVVPDDATDNTLESTPSIHAAYGLSRMLCELKCQFDVILPDQPFEPYRMLIFVDTVRFDSELAERVRSFLKEGGRVISCGWSGVTPDGGGFALPEFWPCSFDGDSAHDPAYFRVGDSAAFPGVPEMPVTLYEKGTSIHAPDECRMAEIVAPYYNRHFDGEHAFLYLPPDRASGECALAINGQVAHFSHPLGISYYRHAQVPLRELLRGAVERLLPEPLLRTERLPSFARATVMRQPERTLIWLTAFVPERRGGAIDMIEEPIRLGAVDLTLRTDGAPIRKVSVAPGAKALSFRQEGAFVSFTLPEMDGYAVICVE